MPTVETAFFCEKSYVMNDGKHFAAGLLPGIMTYKGPVQPNFLVDAYLAVRFDHVGDHRLDLLVSTEKGRTVVMSSIDCKVSDPRFPAQIAMGNIPLPLHDGETFIVSTREGSGPWSKACSLRMVVSFEDEAAAALRAS